MKNQNIILVGNQNVGKSTLFNALTGLKQKTSNYPGVTIEEKKGTYDFENKKYNLIDLPGAYSLYPTSLDEDVVYQSIINQTKEQNAIFAYVVDASNIERNLLFFTQLMDLGLQTIIIITMNDVARKKGISVDEKKMSELLGGIKVLKLENYNNKSIASLKKSISNIEVKTENNHFSNLKDYVSMPFSEMFARRSEKFPYVMLCKLLKEKGKLKLKSQDNLSTSENTLNEQWVEARDVIQKDELAIRFKSLRQILSFCVKREYNVPESKQLFWDKILTHKVWGVVTFFAIIAIIFQAIFSWSSIPMDLIDEFFSYSSEMVLSMSPGSVYIQLIAQGIIPGIGGVMIFVPQITILFAFLLVLEESGYMTRVVFILDKFMRPMGLSGRSVVPLISGVACAVPAIQSAKGIESWKERLITILVIPFMSCSARLPVYTTIIAIMIPKSSSLWGVFNLHGLILFGLYVIGVVASLFFSLILKNIIKSDSKSFLIMEMPDYRIPKIKNIILQIYNKVKPFVVEVGKLIVMFSIILWFLGSFGFEEEKQNKINAFKTSTKWQNASDSEKEYQLNSINLETSYLGWLGKSIAPIFKPLGYDWKISIAILTSFAAREIFIGTLATIYSVGEEKQKPLLRKMKNEKNNRNEPIYSMATCFSLLIFYALAMQCVSTLAIVKKELGTWKWPIIQFFSMSFIAYLGAFLTFLVFSSL